MNIEEVQLKWFDDEPDNFQEPTLSIIDRRSYRWQLRKKYWQKRGINLNLGRKENLIYRPALSTDSIISQKIRSVSNGTSLFDPVLAECLIEWFTKNNDKIFDPFAGGNVRGLVSSLKRRNYTGIDLSYTQIKANNESINLCNKDYLPNWIVGNSCELKNIQLNKHDFILTCPPYFNLEKYSDNPNDLSNMEWDTFLVNYQKIIKNSVEILNENRFIAWVIGDVRDKKGYLLPLMSETIKAFNDLNINLYNHLVTADIIGSGAMVMKERFIKSRKFVTKHQHCLIFVKGDPVKSTERLNPKRPNALQKNSL